jgi:DNA-binding transcriptional LysR family regulator
MSQLLTFISVADLNSFTKTADHLNLPKTTVTRHIQELEKEYDAIFFSRTTRHVSLTEQGKTFYQYAVDASKLQQEMLNDIQDTHCPIRGRIKIGAPASLLRFFSSHMHEFLLEFPNLEFEFIQGNHVLDIFNGQFDIVFHCSPLPDINAYYEQIGNWSMTTCASPDYLKNGKPASPNDLCKFNCLDHADNHGMEWIFHKDGAQISIPVKGNIRVDSSILLKEFALSNQGIIHLPSFSVCCEMSEKTLTPILEKYTKKQHPIYVIYPQKKEHNRKAAEFIDFLKSYFTFSGYQPSN